MAAETDIIRYMITGELGEVIPSNATHVSVHPSFKVIPQRQFHQHRKIVELICHDGVIKIEEYAFCGCRRLKRVIMKDVEKVEEGAFGGCKALEYVECDKLEIIGEDAFSSCRSIANISLPSAKIVRRCAFCACPALVGVVFGCKLESIDETVFLACRSLNRITLPLKIGLIIHYGAFHECENLKHVELVDGEVIQQTIDALLWEDWKNDMNSELLSIDQILPNTRAGDMYNNGEKAVVIRQWISDVLRKMINYKSQHCRLLKEAVSRLQLALAHDIVMNNVVPFLQLPHHKIDGEEEIDERDDGNESIDETYSSNVGSNEEEDDHDGKEEGDAETGEEGKQGANDEERRKRQRTGNNDEI